jgi:hypothetical protein
MRNHPFPWLSQENVNKVPLHDRDNMKLINEEEFRNYVRLNFEMIYESPASELKEQELPGKCDFCQKEAFLKIHALRYQQGYYREDGVPYFVTFFIECPQCRRKSFIKTVQLQVYKPTGNKDAYGEDETSAVFQFFKLFRLPSAEESYENKDIPEEYVSLKATVTEASFCLSHSKNIAATILFRRALQILAKDVLGAPGTTLNSQLNWLKTNPNALGIEIGAVFHDNAEIIRKIGNQGAHPDEDATLHNFTKEDAEGLHDLFISIIHELFISPAKLKAIQD